MYLCNYFGSNEGINNLRINKGGHECGWTAGCFTVVLVRALCTVLLTATTPHSLTEQNCNVQLADLSEQSTGMPYGPKYKRLLVVLNFVVPTSCQ